MLLKMAAVALLLLPNFQLKTHDSKPVAQALLQQSTEAKDQVMHHATGTFDVTMKPLAAPPADTGLARMSIDKVFHGGIDGTSRGEMISSGNPSSGSAGYVALEKVTCKLDGAEGTFVLQHSATMNRGVPSLSITVVPDSGTGALEGIAGKLDIQIDHGKHSYTFDYTL